MEHSISAIQITENLYAKTSDSEETIEMPVTPYLGPL